MHHLLKACAAAVLLLWSCNITADNRNGRWEVVTNSDHTVTLLCNGDTLLSRAASTARLDGRTVSSQSYRKQQVRTRRTQDPLGKALEIRIRHTDRALPQMEISYRLYDHGRFVTVQSTLSDKKGVSTNGLTPSPPKSSRCGPEVRHAPCSSLSTTTAGSATRRIRSASDA